MTSFGLIRASVAASSAGRAFRDHEFGRRDIDPGKPDAVAAGRGAGARDCQQVIVGAGVQQRVFGQRARRHQPHHAAGAPRSCCRARARGGRVLGLLAHRDAMAGVDQAMQIILGALHRHAAHRDVHALMLAALGQHDAERLGGDFGVLEEQLVEIAHPVEQQQPGMGGLDLKVLFHHRRDARRRVSGRRGSGGAGAGMDCWIVIAAAQTTKFLPPGPIRFAAVHQSFPPAPRALVHHASVGGMTDLPRKHAPGR